MSTPARSTGPHPDRHDDPERHLPTHHNPLPELSGPDDGEIAAADFARVQSSDEFQELKKRFRHFAFPLSIAFLVWYFAFVLMSTYAVDLMSRKILGNVTIGLVWGLLQFVTTFGITAAYIRHANRNLDPIATKLRADLEGTR